jgi:hypothetical protein
MEISFVWEGNPPERPNAEEVQKSLEFALTHMPDPRGLLPQLSAVHLSQDALKFNVVGVGWSKDDRRIVTLRHALVEPRTSFWDYYENPLRSPGVLRDIDRPSDLIA